MTSKRASVESTADAYIELLTARGVEYLFANAGTDFAPLIEAFAKRAATGQPSLRPLTIPHEVPAVAMAHGYTMVTGRPQAVMVHVIVGAANAIGGIMNAARSNVPILFTAGRNPITEQGFAGSRDRPIHWAQESFDQGALAREFVKWDYELRNFAQLETVVDRALAIASAEPPGPVYLTLPREVLGERQETFEYSATTRAPRPSESVAARAAVAKAAQVLAAAANPMIITKAAGRDPVAIPAMVALAEALGAPVVEQFHTHLNFPQDHPLHGGFDASPYFGKADAIVIVESDVPWFPSGAHPKPDTKLIHIASDPLFSRYPVRGFEADVALAGQPRLTMHALADAVRGLVEPAVVAERRRRAEEEHAQRRDEIARRARAASTQNPIEMSWVSRCVGDVIDDQTIVVNEYDLEASQACFTVPGSYFAASPAGGLGWGLGAALGAKLAAPEKTVIACVGDGAYMFGAPTAAHWVSRAYSLPTLTIIFNNRVWNAVKRSVHSFAKDGWAARSGAMPLTELDPPPDYELVCQASGGWAEKVEDAAKLPEALARALKVVREEKRQALLNVIVKKPA
ncbi:MAG: thiamine pyrophosphate-requiring protein [Candidatus Rokubacteria bacterium]|nr:thiamine pyrophosphate-requiring protein [Candidatus Rokubacteria bacterium]